MPLAAYGCEHALLCQRLDKNARRLASILEALFYVVHLAGLAALFDGRLIALSPSARYGQEPKKGGGMTKKVADLFVAVLGESGVRRIYSVAGDSMYRITASIRGKNNIERVD